MMLITLQQAKDHLMMDHDQDDTHITLLANAAGAAVIEYLKDGATFLDSSGEVPVDSAGEPDGIPYNVQAATLILLAEMYKNREGLTEDPIGGAAQITYGYGYLPRSAVALLYPLREPTVA